MIPECAYDLEQTWEHNAEHGPRLTGTPPLVPATPLKQFLGLPVRSRIGIAAGMLLNGRWILSFAARGFDLLTYKTVRSAAHPCHPMPNWVFVDDHGVPDGPVIALDRPSGDPTRLSSAVCFGMPSVHPDVWRKDLRATVSALGKGQVLIASVVGTPTRCASLDDLAEDFARCAVWAAEAGAPVVEANLSCPNVCSAEGTLHLNPKATQTVVRRLRAALGATRLLLKVGMFPGEAEQDRFLDAVAGLADGLTLVNCISRPVLRPDGRPVFGEAFRMAGVLGRTIHIPSVDAVARLRRRLDEKGIPMAIAAVGGVSTPDDVGDFLQAGADAVLCGSAPMYLPDLAIQTKALHPDW